MGSECASSNNFLMKIWNKKLNEILHFVYRAKCFIYTLQNACYETHIKFSNYKNQSICAMMIIFVIRSNRWKRKQFDSVCLSPSKNINGLALIFWKQKFTHVNTRLYKWVLILFINELNWVLFDFFWIFLFSFSVKTRIANGYE